jgi:dienelactone hydrolase
MQSLIRPAALCRSFFIASLLFFDFGCGLHQEAIADPLVTSLIRSALAKADTAFEKRDLDAYLADYAPDYTETDSSGKVVLSSKAQKQTAVIKALADMSNVYTKSAVKEADTADGGVIATVQTETAYTIMEGLTPVTDVYALSTEREFWVKNGSGWALKRSRQLSDQVERTGVRDWPGLGSAQEIVPGVLFYQVRLPRPGESKLWVYLPAQHTGKIGCIFIAPAGTPLIYGNDLGDPGDGDQAEHVPYAQAGYAVVAYELDGSVPDDHPTNDQINAGIKAFMNADSGMVNARMAIDYALARVPGIDPKRLYSAGHSSAATVSLLLAERDPRIAACIAYAPVTNISERLGDRRIGIFSNAVPGFADFITRDSPDNNAFSLTCPVFLFHADDDSNVPTSQVSDFADQLKATNEHVTFSRVPTGDHYDSMINQGIPQGIQWLGSLPSP